MMRRFDLLLSVLVTFCWILILHPSKVDAHELFDLLNPANVNLDVWHQRSARVALRTNDLACERPDFYVCEEPPDAVPPEHWKTCDYRNVLHHEQIFRWVAGQGCLFFTPNFLFVAGFNNLNLNGRCLYGNLLAPCMEIPKEDGTCGCFPLDPGFEEVTKVVRQAIVPSAHGRWERCFYAASDCCSHFMGNEIVNDVNITGQAMCRTTFDAWTCWHAAEAGTTAYEVCSEFAYSNEGPSCHRKLALLLEAYYEGDLHGDPWRFTKDFSSKKCFQNATWEAQTDYTTCSVTPRLLRRYRFHIGMLSFSIISSLPAVIIFFVYKRLRITRVALHRNLLIAIIVRNILVIISRSEIYIDAITNSGDTTLSENGVWCRILSLLERLAGNAVFVCMLVEGIYLHRLIVAVFRQKLNINVLHAIGAVITIVPGVAWAIVMGLNNDHSCWVIFTVDHIQWIMDAPRLLILLINTILFLDVLRVLLTKIRNSENAHQLNTAKTTLFLMPIFGSQFLLTAFRPNTTNCAGEQAYFYIAYTVEGLQGFFVALLYCYINKEVRMLLKTTYVKTESAVVSRVRRDSTYPRMSVDPKIDRRLTYSTAVASQNDDAKDQYAAVAPKLHVAEIISIQASERLADILEPVYETIENGVINEGYDSLERSSLDNDSGFIPNRDSRGDTYYGFTNVSSVSIDCQDWIKCISSPSSSVYNNSLTDYEVRYLERKFPNHPKLRERKRQSLQDISQHSDYAQVEKVIDKLEETPRVKRNDESEYEDSEDMFGEIMQYIETTDRITKL